jgi:hypothetical protein
VKWLVGREGGGRAASGWWGEQREGEQLVAGGERRGRVERRAGSAGGRCPLAFFFIFDGGFKK